MKKVKQPLILLLIIIIITIASASYWIYSHYINPADNTIEASGTIEATEVKVVAKISGTLDSLNINEGTQVQKDQVIAILSRPDLYIQRERDLLNIELAQAKLNDLKAGARPQELQEAQANLNIAQENLEKASLDLERMQELYTRGAISLQDLENSQLRKESAQNQLTMAQAKLDMLQAGPRTGTIKSATIELNRMQTILKTTDTMINDLTIKSPLAGTVLTQNYEVGEFIPVGGNIATIANLNDLWITVFIPSDELCHVKLGQKVKCFISGDSNVYKGKVIYVADRGEFTPKMIQTKKERANIVYRVKISIKNIDNRLKPGMPVDVLFKRGE